MNPQDSATGARSSRAVPEPSLPQQSSLMHRYLDPASSLGEVLFGLIMTLTFTLSAGIIIQDEGREGARQLLIAVLGCNIAWGIIDGALYLVGQLFDRGRLQRLGRSIRETSSAPTAATIVAGELDPLVGEILSVHERNALYTRIATNIMQRPMQHVGVRKDDWLGAVTSFWLVVLATAPAAIPFAFIDQAHLALRVSNAILLGLMFFSGYWWARYTLSRPWLVGTLFLIFGTVLVIAAIALGG